MTSTRENMEMLGPHTFISHTKDYGWMDALTHGHHDGWIGDIVNEKCRDEKKTQQGCSISFVHVL